MTRMAAVALLLVPAAALRPSGLRGQVGRRAAIGQLGAAGFCLGSPLALPPALALDESEISSVVPMATLVAGLASAPARDVVITGANSGVGLAGAKLLTAAGHRVVLACRTQAKADAAAAACEEYALANGRRRGGSARGAECDLASLASVRAFAAGIKDRPLDSLVLNAGLAHGQGESIVYRTAEGFEETIGVNHLGHFLLAQLLTPTLSKSPRARLVITASPVHDPSSGGGDVGARATLGDFAGMAAGPGFSMVDGGPYDPDKAYKDSKLCNMCFMAEAARRLAPEGVTVNAFSPGLIADPNGFFRNQNKLFATAFNLITQAVGVAESNDFGGSALAYMTADAALDGVSGAWYDTYPPGKHQLAVHSASSEARRLETQARLWELSEKLVQA